MKSIKIDCVVFNEIIKTIRGSVSHDDSRPVLKKCKCEVDEKFIKFVSLDGWCATVVKLEHGQQDVEKFEFVFDTFTVEYNKKNPDYLCIDRQEDKIIFTWYDANRNKVSKFVKDWQESYLNYAQIFENSRVDDSMTISFNAGMLARMLKGFNNKGGYVVDITFSKDNPAKPIFIKSQNDILGEVEALVLPVRRF